jgi:hypothetical protein
MANFPERAEKVQAEKETGRLEAFSDGVFAIAITLLVLELKVPQIAAPNSAALYAGLGQGWPSYVAFVTSFFTILIMWVHHHAVFKQVHRADATLFFSNGFLLLLVTAVPFSDRRAGRVSAYARGAGGLRSVRRDIRADQHRLLPADPGGVPRIRAEGGRIRVGDLSHPQKLPLRSAAVFDRRTRRARSAMAVSCDLYRAVDFLGGNDARQLFAIALTASGCSRTL